jgi:hypothetical protein
MSHQKESMELVSSKQDYKIKMTIIILTKNKIKNAVDDKYIITIKFSL